MALASSCLSANPITAPFSCSRSLFPSRSQFIPCVTSERRAGKGARICHSSTKLNEHVPYCSTSSVHLRCHYPSRHLRMLAMVKSGEAEGRPSTDETTFDEQTLQWELEKAIEEEDYARAAQLRDHLRVAHEDNTASVLSANARFYHAFGIGDLSAMRSIWARGDDVYVVHPGAGRISGYELVMDSWEVVCGAEQEFPIRIDLKNVEVHVTGSVGYVTCMEVVKSRGSSWGKQIATNVFERIGDEWFMCIHHASHITE